MKTVANSGPGFWKCWPSVDDYNNNYCYYYYYHHHYYYYCYYYYYDDYYKDDDDADEDDDEDDDDDGDCGTLTFAIDVQKHGHCQVDPGRKKFKGLDAESSGWIFPLNTSPVNKQGSI